MAKAWAYPRSKFGGPSTPTFPFQGVYPPRQVGQQPLIPPSILPFPIRLSPIAKITFSAYPSQTTNRSTRHVLS